MTPIRMTEMFRDVGIEEGDYCLVIFKAAPTAPTIDPENPQQMAMMLNTLTFIFKGCPSEDIVALESVTKQGVSRTWLTTLDSIMIAKAEGDAIAAPTPRIHTLS